MDDEPELLEISKIFLEMDGLIRITSVTGGEEALRLLRECGFDAIISDYRMLVMNGIELLKEIRSQGDSTPFVIFTGKGREDVVIHALEEGADFYLQKGRDPHAIYAELSHNVRRAAERRSADLALRKSERRLNRAEEVAGLGHWELHLNEGIMKGSRGAARLYGLDHTEMPYGAVKGIPLPEYRPILDEALKNLIERAERYDLTMRNRRRSDGKVLDIHTLAEYDPVKKVVFGVLHDVSAQKRAFDSLVKARDQLRMAMDMANIVTWEYDLASDRVTFDMQFHSFFGTRVDTNWESRMSFSEYSARFLPPEAEKVFTAEFKMAIDSKDPAYVRRLEHGYMRDDGRKGILMVVFRVVTDQNGAIVKLIGTVQDITDLRKEDSRLADEQDGND